jgi:hypothetical protein
VGLDNDIERTWRIMDGCLQELGIGGRHSGRSQAGALPVGGAG